MEVVFWPLYALVFLVFYLIENWSGTKRISLDKYKKDEVSDARETRKVFTLVD